MKRIALFAHYDRDGIVDDYVVYYLRGLARVAGKILFASDCALAAGEADKLEGLAEIVSASRHGEYDFGSWKRCLEHLNFDLAGWDELILANDSCYAPIYPFEDAFEKMGQSGCHFWGPTANQKKGRFDHISSYFLVLRRPILQDDAFLQFWSRVQPQSAVIDVIVEYEIGLSDLLVARGYVYDSLLPPANIGSFAITHYVHQDLHTYKSCWLKVRVVRDNPKRVARLAEAIRKLQGLYPTDFIDAHLIRTLGTAKPNHHFYFFGGNWRFKRFGLEIACHLKGGKPHKQVNRKFDWIKIYTYLFGVPVFAMTFPVRRAYHH